MSDADADADVRRQIRSATDLRRFADELGFDLDLEERVRALMLALKEKLVRQEVMQGHYDSGEIARRLQRLETQGAFFSSLVYPLLRIAAASVGSRPAADRRTRAR